MKKHTGYLVRYETVCPTGQTIQHTRTGFKTLLRAIRTAYAIKASFYTDGVSIWATFEDRPAERRLSI